MVFWETACFSAQALFFIYTGYVSLIPVNPYWSAILHESSALALPKCHFTLLVMKKKKLNSCFVLTQFSHILVLANALRHGKSTFRISARAKSPCSFTHLEERLVLFTWTRLMPVKASFPLRAQASHDHRLAVSCGICPVSMSLVPEWDGLFFPSSPSRLQHLRTLSFVQVCVITVTRITATKTFLCLLARIFWGKITPHAPSLFTHSRKKQQPSQICQKFTFFAMTIRKKIDFKKKYHKYIML